MLEGSRELRIVLCREQNTGSRNRSSVVAACGESFAFLLMVAVSNCSPLSQLCLQLITRVHRSSPAQTASQPLSSAFCNAAVSQHTQFALCENCMHTISSGIEVVRSQQLQLDVL